jgi:putative tryptophan/tyrosine transport system substrate-binding protein
MQRRNFLGVLGGAAAWPLAARAQPTVPVIGIMHSTPDTESRRADLAVFHSGLAQMGYADGRNVKIEYRWAEDRYDLLPALAADLVHRQVAVIAALFSTTCALAAKAATQTIPVVFVVGANPVEKGLVASLNKPGGNLTGATILALALAAKKLQVLHEVVPAADLIAVLTNPTNLAFAGDELNELSNAARVLGVRLLVLNAARISDLETVFARLTEERAGALLVSADTLFLSARDQIIALAARHAVPAIYQYREMALAGGLMSYGPNSSDAYRIAGGYTGRILKGEKPADLPVQQLTKLDLVINLKTAKALGLTIPLSLLARADEVIE